MVNPRKIRAAISIGDPNGIGIEIILKSLSKEEVLDKIIPIVFGSYNLIMNQAQALGQEVSMLHPISEINNAKENRINILNVFDNCDYKYDIAFTSYRCPPATGLAFTDTPGCGPRLDPRTFPCGAWASLPRRST